MKNRGAERWMAAALLAGWAAGARAQVADVDPGSRVDVGLPSRTGPNLEVEAGAGGGSVDLTTPDGRRVQAGVPGFGSAAAPQRAEAELVEAGMLESHARKIVEAARGSGADVAQVARAAREAYRNGASSRELAVLSEDLAKEDAGTDGLTAAIEAVGALAEEGFADRETSRGVALTALQGLKDGLRGQALAELVSSEARDLALDRDRREEGLGRAADAVPPEVRNELRQMPPAGAGLGENAPGPRGRP